MAAPSITGVLTDTQQTNVGKPQQLRLYQAGGVSDQAIIELGYKVNGSSAVANTADLYLPYGDNGSLIGMYQTFDAFRTSTNSKLGILEDGTVNELREIAATFDTNGAEYKSKINSILAFLTSAFGSHGITDIGTQNEAKDLGDASLLDNQDLDDLEAKFAALALALTGYIAGDASSARGVVTALYPFVDGLNDAITAYSVNNSAWSDANTYSAYYALVEGAAGQVNLASFSHAGFTVNNLQSVATDAYPSP